MEGCGICRVLVIAFLAVGSCHSKAMSPTEATFAENAFLSLKERTKAAPCEDVLSGPRGRLESPEYPGDFPDNTACAWDIIVEQGSQISFRFTDFHLQPSQECTADYVGVYDGENYALYCGWQAPPAITSKGNVMSVVLVSDGQVHIGSRFAAEFQEITSNSSNSCPGEENYYVSSVYDYGFTSSPRYPNNYPNSADYRRCSQRFTAAGEISKVVLGLLQLRTQSGDRVTIDINSGSIVDTYSGYLDFGLNMPPRHESYTSSVHLESDSSGTDVGYLAAYASDISDICVAENHSSGNEFPTTDATTDGVTDTVNPCVRLEEAGKSKPDYSTPEEPQRTVRINIDQGTMQPDSVDGLVELIPGRNFGFIKSPFHPQNYPNSGTTNYVVDAAAGSRIAFMFLRYNVETCCDYLTLSENGQTFWSNGETRKVFYSTSNEVSIRFSTDGSVSRSGFLLAFASIEP